MFSEMARTIEDSINLNGSKLQQVGAEKEYILKLKEKNKEQR